MLVVRVEVWPGGAEHRRREIGRARIANVSDLDDVSDYAFEIEGDGSTRLGVRPVRLEGSVERVPRSESAWQLLRRILDRAFVEDEPSST